MGCSPLVYLFNQNTNNMVKGMENMVKELDDMLLFSDTIKGFADKLENMLTRFVTLAPKKIKFDTKALFMGSASPKTVAQLIQTRWTLCPTSHDQSPNPK